MEIRGTGSGGDLLLAGSAAALGWIRRNGVNSVNGLILDEIIWVWMGEIMDVQAEIEGAEMLRQHRCIQ
jgi:hypothetical protein